MRKSELPQSFMKLYDKENLKEKGVIIKEIKLLNTSVYSGFVDLMMYVRDDSRKPVGVVVINNGYCGWSLCHKNDKWNKELGIYKAICKLESKETIGLIRTNLGGIGKNKDILEDLRNGRDVKKREHNKERLLLRTLWKIYLFQENQEKNNKEDIPF